MALAPPPKHLVRLPKTFSLLPMGPLPSSLTCSCLGPARLSWHREHSPLTPLRVPLFSQGQQQGLVPWWDLPFLFGEISELEDGLLRPPVA